MLEISIMMVRRIVLSTIWLWMLMWYAAMTGDLDIVVKQLEGTMQYFDNRGSRNKPQFYRQTGMHPFTGIVAKDGSTTNHIMTVDPDGDGVFDIYVASQFSSIGQLSYLSCTPVLSPLYSEMRNKANPFALVSQQSQAMPVLSDWDDGDLDLFLMIAFPGHNQEGYSSEVKYYSNNDTKGFPNYVEVTSLADNPLSVFNRHPVPMASVLLRDWDNDGDKDLLVSSLFGIKVIKNDATAGSSTPVWNTSALVSCSLTDFGKPEMLDLDNDGDLDMVLGQGTSLLYLENIGTSSAPEFAEPRAHSAFSGIGVPFGSSTMLGFFADMDGDGECRRLFIYNMFTD
jgi:hypothetical protein